MNSVSKQSAAELSVAFIGYGEAANAFVEGWNGQFAKSLSAYDIKTVRMDDERAKKYEEYEISGVSGYDTAAEAVAAADVVFSLVTADQALNAAQSVAGSLKKNCLYFDCNSCAPETKRKAASLFENRECTYVDVAIMAPIHPKLHQTPVLVSGPKVNSVMEAIEALGMSAKFTTGDIGAASSIKMVRSIMVKGLEALVAECVLAGRKAGVEDVVLDSLDATFPGFDWKNRAAYMLERMMVHGERRAAEMGEVALMLDDLGLNNGMTSAAIKWQETIGNLKLSGDEDDYQLRADRIIEELDKQTSK